MRHHHSWLLVGKRLPVYASPASSILVLDISTCGDEASTNVVYLRALVMQLLMVAAGDKCKKIGCCARNLIVVQLEGHAPDWLFISRDVDEDAWVVRAAVLVLSLTMCIAIVHSRQHLLQHSWVA